MHEIIHIVDPESLAGQVRHALEIEAVNDRPLAAGYYFVIWPAARQHKGRHPGKRYFGPFPTCVEARLLQRSALALGLIQDESASHEIAECRSIVRPLTATLYPAVYRSHALQRQELAELAA